MYKQDIKSHWLYPLYMCLCEGVCAYAESVGLFQQLLISHQSSKHWGRDGELTQDLFIQENILRRNVIE